MCNSVGAAVQVSLQLVYLYCNLDGVGTLFVVLVVGCTVVESDVLDISCCCNGDVLCAEFF